MVLIKAPETLHGSNKGSRRNGDSESQSVRLLYVESPSVETINSKKKKQLVICSSRQPQVERGDALFFHKLKYDCLEKLCYNRLGFIVLLYVCLYVFIYLS